MSALPPYISVALLADRQLFPLCTHSPALISPLLNPNSPQLRLLQSAHSSSSPRLSSLIYELLLQCFSSPVRSVVSFCRVCQPQEVFPMHFFFSFNAHIVELACWASRPIWFKTLWSHYLFCLSLILISKPISQCKIILYNYIQISL